MKNYLLALCVAVSISACSKKEDDQKVVSKEGESNSAITDCSGTISAGTYFMMNNVWGSGAGRQCIFWNNVNSWGVDASHTTSSSSGIKSYPAVVYGCHWGRCGTGTALPKQISALGNSRTWWTQTGTGSSWNAAYDIWFHPTRDPGNAAARYELMIWLNWNNQKPIAGSYDASGNAIPFARNVTIRDADGTAHVWNIYRRGDVFSFLLATKSNWVSLDIKPIANYCVARGWMSSSAYMTSIQAGWEIISGGTYRTTSFGVAAL